MMQRYVSGAVATGRGMRLGTFRLGSSRDGAQCTCGAGSMVRGGVRCTGWAGRQLHPIGECWRRSSCATTTGSVLGGTTSSSSKTTHRHTPPVWCATGWRHSRVSRSSRGRRDHPTSTPLVRTAGRYRSFANA